MQDAQSWADHLAISGKMEHSKDLPRLGQGENLAWFTPSSDDVTKAATDNWYMEIKAYNYNQPRFTSGTGHFTQVVWKDSTQLGVGLAVSNGEAYVVARYYPAGNMMGRFDQNVLPPSN